MTILLLLCGAASYAQSKGHATVEVSSYDCERQQPLPWLRVDTIKFYRLPEDSLAFVVTPRKQRVWPIKIDDIEPGQYKVRFRNDYFQTLSQNFTVTNNTLNFISICTDRLLDYPQNTLEKLLDQDTISIEYGSFGCFHAIAEKLMIKKEKDKFIARLYKVSAYNQDIKDNLAYKSPGLLLHEITMSEKNIQDFIRFENELNYAPDGGCTTTDFYQVTSQYLKLSKRDGSCSWNGFQHLKIALFGTRQ